eukprot:5510860-Pyramimonas_sp.AAC.1
MWLRLTVEPRQLPRGPRAGCSRCPMDWVPVLQAIDGGMAGCLCSARGARRRRQLGVSRAIDTTGPG